MTTAITWEHKWTETLVADARVANSGGYSEGIDAPAGINTIAVLRFFACIVIALAIGVSVPLGLDQTLALYLISGVVLGYLVFGILFDVFVRHADARLFVKQRLGELPNVVTLDATGITGRGQFSENHATWRAIERTYDAQTGLGLAYKSGDHFIVPDMYLPKGMTRDGLKKQIKGWLTWV